jgi:serine/threonine protein kinase
VDCSAKLFLPAEPPDAACLSRVIGAEPLSTGVALKYAVAVGAILSRAHSMGAIHGRLCPSAVILRGTDAAVLDPSAVSSGFEPYQSPEQVRGEPADERSDVYAFGALVFYMFAGFPPFPAKAADPGWDAAGGRIPIAIRRALEDCFEKSTLRRRQRIQNVTIELRFIEKLARRPVRRLRAEACDAISAAAPLRYPRFSPNWIIAALSVVALATVGVGAAFWLAFR